MYDNNDTSRKLRYRETRTHDCTLKEDVFDGELFRQLKDRRVTWDGESFSRTYFEDDTEVALGLGTDGVPLFARRRLACWPLVITNYSLGPEIRTRKEFQICCGVVPGKSTAEYYVYIVTAICPLIPQC